MRPALIFPLCTALVCAVGFAQAPGTLDPSKQPAKPDENFTFESGVNVVIVPTTVRNRNGEVVDGLQLQDFELYDNDKLQKITADVRDEPLSLAVAVQRSSDLTEILPKIQRVGSMLNQLISGQDGQMAIISFDHRIKVEQDFTSEGAKISEALQKLTPGSSQHAVIDAVDTSIRLLKKQPKERRRVLLLIAEKRDRGSELRLREALTQAQFANIAIYSLDISTLVASLTKEPTPPRPPSVPPEATHLPGNYPATPTTIDQNSNVGNYVPLFVDLFKATKSIFVDDTLDVFTRFTGGREYPFVGERSLEKAIEGISEELHSQYLLSYAPNNQTEGGFHDIRVMVNRPNLEVRTRPGYWVAGRPQ
jgi:VWFA-related protein